jgi:anti-sigma-K factor RskA
MKTYAAIWRAGVLLALTAVVIIVVAKKPERELRPAPALPGPIASHGHHPLR